MSSSVVATGNQGVVNASDHSTDQSGKPLPVGQPLPGTSFPRSSSEPSLTSSSNDNANSVSVSPAPSDSDKDTTVTSNGHPIGGDGNSNTGHDTDSSEDQSLTDENAQNSMGLSRVSVHEIALQRRKPGPAPQIQVRPGVTVCQNCLTTTTPLWRRDENGQIMCNACGLFLKLHGRRRPISLKTDVIKSRNRTNRHNRPGVTQVPPAKRRSAQTPMIVSSQHDNDVKPQPVQPAPQSAAGGPPQPGAARSQQPPPSQPQSANQQPPQPPHQQQPPQPPQQPLHLGGHPGHPGLPMGSLPGIASMGAVPVVYPTSPALSPYIGPGAQGMIMNSPAMTPLAGAVLRQHLGQPLSPQVIAQTTSGPLATGPHGRAVHGAMSEQLLPRSPESTERIPHLAQIPVAQFQKNHHESHQEANKDKTSSLMTRVSELELVNDLLRRRVQDLEASEAEARKQVEALKNALSVSEREQQTKRIKVSELL